jgi:cell division ATPase FtsA
LHSTKWSSRKKKKDWKPCSSKNHLIQDSEGNEEYQAPDPNKDKQHQVAHTSGAHKNILKEEILKVITENFMKKILDMVKQNVQDALKKFQDTKIKNMRRHRNK